MEKDLNVRGLSLDMARRAAADRDRWRTLAVVPDGAESVSDILLLNPFTMYNNSISDTQDSKI